MKKRSQVTPNESRLSFHVIKVEGPKFLTIGPGIVQGWLDVPDLTGVRFVRIRPPESAKDEDVESLRALCAKEGIDVQVAPRPQAQVIVGQAIPKYEEKGIRETVLKMVEEAVTEDRPALLAFVEETLAEVGL